MEWKVLDKGLVEVAIGEGKVIISTKRDVMRRGTGKCVYNGSVAVVDCFPKKGCKLVKLYGNEKLIGTHIVVDDGCVFLSEKGFSPLLIEAMRRRKGSLHEMLLPLIEKGKVACCKLPQLVEEARKLLRAEREKKLKLKKQLNVVAQEFGATIVEVA